MKKTPLTGCCSSDFHKCNKIGECIDQTFIYDGEFDCNDGEYELTCPVVLNRWILEEECNSSNEYFCITTEYLDNQTLNRPCTSFMRATDGFADRIRAQDERNVFPCYDHRILGDLLRVITNQNVLMLARSRADLYLYFKILNCPSYINTHNYIYRYKRDR